ncbi:MAG: AAA family ATPase [Candidatus Puniceispirillaceae bacterium]
MKNIGAYIEPVAIAYWGEPKERHGHELRWGNRGSKSVNLRNGTWFDFENNEGGGVIDLVKHHEGATLSGLPELLERKFGIPKQAQASIQPGKYMSKVYDYIDEDGEVIYQVVRYEPKTFRQRRPDGNGGWLWNMQGVTPVPYNLHLMQAKPDKPVFIVEGEKCADALTALGAVAVTSHGGAKKWSPELNKHFTGRKVIILPDADQAGQDHADMVISQLHGVAEEIKRVDLPGLSGKQDVHDWLKNGGTSAELGRLVGVADPIVFNQVKTEKNNTIYSLHETDHDPDVFETYDINYLRSMPPVEFVVDQMFTRHGLAVVYGEPGAGKSFIAIDLALSIAYGKPWHEHAVEQGAVLYIAGEGVGGLGKRVKAWQAHHGLTGAADFHVLPTAVKFRDTGDVEKLMRTIDALDKPFKAVFIDTVARALLGGDENSATDIGLFVDACDAVKRHTGSAVIAIHHSGKDSSRGMRGSSSLLGGVDTSIRVSKVEDAVTMVTEKQKDAEPADDMAFEMTQIALIGDVSAVMTVTDAPKKRRKVKLTEPQNIALQCLQNLCAEIGRERVPISVWHDKHRVKTPDSTTGARRDARNQLQNKRVIIIEDGQVWKNKDLEQNV